MHAYPIKTDDIHINIHILKKTRIQKLKQKSKKYNIHLVS